MLTATTVIGNSRELSISISGKIAEKQRRKDANKMEHISKIIIGANYGDEGKGLVSRSFSVRAIKAGHSPITILHNGTAQRGHTVDYSPEFRHVYHHFGSGTLDGVSTFFAKSFLVHPVSFVKEYNELCGKINMPEIFCDPNCIVITPLDMLADHAIEEDIAVKYGEREYGSCGYGSWSATDRIAEFPEYAYSVKDFMDKDRYPEIMKNLWKWVLSRMECFNVDTERLPDFRKYFMPESKHVAGIIRHFATDVEFFLKHVHLTDFGGIWNAFDYTIFENGQGLGLDMDVPYEWHTTSKTGLANPKAMLMEYKDFKAEAIYVTRAYLTRHGVGRLEEEVCKESINADMRDATNVTNDFQGSLRYGYIEEAEQSRRITDDWKTVAGDSRFEKSIATTHCNEFCELRNYSRYQSFDPFTMRENQ